MALPTAEAEYIALAAASQEAIWIRRLLTELKSPPSHATIIYEDIQSCISITKNPQFQSV